MMSEATEILDTDFEDDSDYERAGSFESVSCTCHEHVKDTDIHLTVRQQKTKPDNHLFI